MYRETVPEHEITLNSGVKVNPVATLFDEIRGKVHIWVQDSSYVSGFEMDGCVTKLTHIFPELFDKLKELPNPASVGSFSAHM